MPDELLLGWVIHYAAGIALAMLLVGVHGVMWLQPPTWLPALAFGMATVVIPLFVMQPAMGAGVASSLTPKLLKNCLCSLATHTVFEYGLYLFSAMLKQVWA